MRGSRQLITYLGFRPAWILHHWHSIAVDLFSIFLGSIYLSIRPNIPSAQYSQPSCKPQPKAMIRSLSHSCKHVAYYRRLHALISWQLQSLYVYRGGYGTVSQTNCNKYEYKRTTWFFLCCFLSHWRPGRECTVCTGSPGVNELVRKVPAQIAWEKPKRRGCTSNQFSFGRRKVGFSVAPSVSMSSLTEWTVTFQTWPSLPLASMRMTRVKLFSLQLLEGVSYSVSIIV